MIVYALLDDFQIQGFTVKSNFNSLEKKLADLSLQIDELIYFKNKKIKTVCLVRDAHPLIIHNCQSNSIYFTSSDPDGSFYCTPDVFAQVAGLYKLDYTTKINPQYFDSFFSSTVNPTRLLTNKLIYIIDRLGIDIHVG